MFHPSDVGSINTHTPKTQNPKPFYIVFHISLCAFHSLHTHAIHCILLCSASYCIALLIAFIGWCFDSQSLVWWGLPDYLPHFPPVAPPQAARKPRGTGSIAHSL